MDPTCVVLKGSFNSWSLAWALCWYLTDLIWLDPRSWHSHVESGGDLNCDGKDHDSRGYLAFEGSLRGCLASLETRLHYSFVMKEHKDLR